MTGTARESKNRRDVTAQGTAVIIFQLTFVMTTADLLHPDLKVNSVLILFCLPRLEIMGISLITDFISFDVFRFSIKKSTFILQYIDFWSFLFTFVNPDFRQMEDTG